MLQQLLNPPLDERLLETATVVFLLAIYQLFALLFPVELVVNISGCDRYWQLWIDQLRDRFPHVFVFDAFQLRVLLVVLGHDFQRHLDQRLDVL